MFKPNSNYEVFDEDMEFRIKEIADFTGASTPPGTAVVILMAKQQPGKLEFFFMSNLSRADMLKLMKNYIKSEEEKDTNAL